MNILVFDKENRSEHFASSLIEMKVEARIIFIDELEKAKYYVMNNNVGILCVGDVKGNDELIQLVEDTNFVAENKKFISVVFYHGYDSESVEQFKKIMPRICYHPYADIYPYFVIDTFNQW